MLEVLVPPVDVPGVSQGMPEPLLLRGDLFPQQLDTPGGQKRHHDGHGLTHRRVGGHLGTGGDMASSPSTGDGRIGSNVLTYRGQC